MRSAKRYFALLILLIPIFSYAAVTVTVNGSTHQIPTTNERGWGSAVTSWIQAISANTLQPSGGTFTLTADVDFGATYGLKTTYIKSRAANISSSGVLRLGNAESIGWRNAANSGNLLLTVNSSDQLTFNGNPILGSAALNASRAVATDSNGLLTTTSVTSTELGYLAGVTSAIQTQINGKQASGNYITDLTGDVTASGPGSASATIANGAITDAKVSASAAIARSKIASGTASHVIINDGSGNLSSEATLSKARGGAGADMSSVTFPSSGTLATVPSAGVVKSSGTALTSGNIDLTSEVTGFLPKANGGLGADLSAVTFPSSGVIVTEGATQTLSSKTLASPTITGAQLLEEQASTPSNPAAGYRKLYAKTDGKLYTLNSSGAEVEAGSGGYAVYANESVSNGGSITTVTNERMQMRPVSGNSGAVSASATPFGTTGGWQNGTQVLLVGTSDADTVTLTFNDAAKGAVGNFSEIEISRFVTVTLVYNQALDRWIVVK